MPDSFSKFSVLNGSLLLFPPCHEVLHQVEFFIQGVLGSHADISAFLTDFPQGSKNNETLTSQQNTFTSHPITKISIPNITECGKELSNSQMGIRKMFENEFICIFFNQ